MPSIKLPAEVMKDILADGSKVVEDVIVENRRWITVHTIVFKYGGCFYSTWYQCGSTEMQDEQPWEYDTEVECDQVHQVEKLVKVWEVVA